MNSSVWQSLASLFRSERKSRQPIIRIQNTVTVVALALMSSAAIALAQPTINSAYPPTLTDRAGDHVAYVVSATASSGSLSYAWYQTGNSTVLSTSNSLVLINIQPANAGTYYAVVTDSKGSTTSGNMILNVLATSTLALYPTNLVVARVGDGVQTLSGSTGNTLYLDQYTASGTYINSIQIPDEGTGQPYGAGSSSSTNLPFGSPALLVAGSNVSPGNDAGYEAFLSRATNGGTLSFGGYCQAYPFAGSDVSAEPGGNGGNNWRGIGAVDAYGYYMLVWTNSGLYSGGNHQFHGATDLNGSGTNFYTTGEAGSGNGLKYASTSFEPANGLGLASVAGSIAGTRVAQIVGGNLVFSDGAASTNGIYLCVGLPVASTNTVLLVAETNSPMDFAFSPDLRTLYIADNAAFGGTGKPAGGIQRWDASGPGPSGFPAYRYSYTLGTGTGSTVGARGLTVDFSAASTWGSNVTGAITYVTTAEASGNRLLRILDTGAGSGATLLAAAAHNQMLAGVRFGPVVVAPAFVVQPQSESASIGSPVTFTALAAGSGPLTYQWFFEPAGASSFSTIANATNASYTFSAAGSGDVGNYYVVVTNILWLSAQSQTVSFSLPGVSAVTVSVNTQSPGAVIPEDFLGLSFETGNLLSNAVGVAGYMFDSANTQLVTLFTNLGIKNLRIGGQSVDRDNGVILQYTPTNADIDALFRFADAAGVKVIFSLRLENGNPSLDAAIAGYAWTNYNQYLTCFAIGNEPDGYAGGDPTITNFSSYLAKWTSFAATITNAVPAAKFGGPDGAGTSWTGPFANAEVGSPIVTWVLSHFYFGGNSGSLTAEQIISGMLSPNWVTNKYPADYNATDAIAYADGFPFRATEFNSYVASYPGVWGGNNSFASALFACDSAHWWAANGCQGVDFHTFLGKYNATVYYDVNGNYQIYPIGYGQKAFDVGGHGSVMPLVLTNNDGLNLTAYAVGAGTNLYVTIINKEYGANARDASVSILPAGFVNGTVQAMFLTATNGVGATNGVTLGGAFITNNAPWLGQWTTLSFLTNGQCVVTVPNSSAAVVKIQATALVTAPVVIAAAPQPVYTFVGEPYNLTVGVTGDAPLAYQWQLNGVNIQGATTTSLVFPSLQVTNSGTYTVVVSNPISTNSSSAVVSVSPPVLNPAAFAYRMAIAFPGYGGGTTLANFPALVQFNPGLGGFSYGQFASGTGGDLRFTDATGTNVLPHEINVWNPSGTSSVWVQVPALSPAGTEIWAYWGNPSPTQPAWSASSVWQPEYMLVYHMEQSALPYQDSAGLYPATTGVAPGVTSGVIGSGGLFNGTSSYLSAGTVNLGNAFTLFVWANIPPSATGIQPLWVSQGPAQSDNGFAFYPQFGSGVNKLYFASGNGTVGEAAASGVNTVTLGVWHCFVASVNAAADTVQLYVDGVRVESGYTEPGFTTDSVLDLGTYVGNTGGLHGSVDEARIATSACSADWIHATWLNMASTSAFNSYSVVNPSLAPPQFGGNGAPPLTLSGNGGGVLNFSGPAGQAYRVWGSTNLALTPVTSTWTLLGSGTFSGGADSLAIGATNGCQFYVITQP
jgi:hypothetical protein